MTTWRRTSSEALRALMTGIRDTRWSWQPEDVEDLCRRMGWTLSEIIDDMGGFADAGLDLPRGQVTIVFRDGQVGDVKIYVTDSADADDRDRDRFVSDAFADAVDEGVVALGEPTARLHAEPPTVRWRLDDATVLIKKLSNAVTVTWANNTWQDKWDEAVETLS